MRNMISLFVMLFIAVSLRAGEVMLQWDASPAETVTNYRIYRGNAPGTYTAHDHLANVLTHTVTGLGPGTWYFTATALDAAGNESDFSNEVSLIIEAPTEFKIATLAASMRWFGVVLLCTTSANASAILRYTDLDTGERQTVIATPDPIKTQHRAVLYLNMGTPKYYRYEWTVTSAGGEVVVDGATFQIR